ncbi:hypothetical protein I4F81_010287 [Pyropia yezoensis]|uniref:Uncharacterized protein n=1 Tax=Pyropia yezoensis TaxID=2788 RepID=A0ACC3CC81_PYRYE|nr:hypothetical protein I4F81_010287 [Neopyropia yezoensis]
MGLEWGGGTPEWDGWASQLALDLALRQQRRQHPDDRVEVFRGRRNRLLSRSRPRCRRTSGATVIVKDHAAEPHTTSDAFFLATLFEETSITTTSTDHRRRPSPLTSPTDHPR